MNNFLVGSLIFAAVTVFFACSCFGDGVEFSNVVEDSSSLDDDAFSGNFRVLLSRWFVLVFGLKTLSPRGFSWLWSTASSFSCWFCTSLVVGLIC